MTDNPNMKKNAPSKRRCRYRILLAGQKGEQTDKPKKIYALIQEASVGVQTQLTDESSDNLELGILQFTVVVQLFILRKTIVFQGFRGVPSFCKGG